MPNDDRAPERIADVVTRYLRQSGIAGRIQQSRVIDDWAELVGPDIAAVTQPVSIAADGSMLVAVKTAPWMNELGMLERDLLECVNRVTSDRPILKFRWVLMR